MELQIKELFGACGEVEKVELFKTPEHDQPKAGVLSHKLGYVTFAEEDGRKVALHLSNQLFLDQYLLIEAAESVPEDLESVEGHPGASTLEADVKALNTAQRMAPAMGMMGIRPGMGMPG